MQQTKIKSGDKYCYVINKKIKHNNKKEILKYKMRAKSVNLTKIKI